MVYRNVHYFNQVNFTVIISVTVFQLTTSCLNYISGKKYAIFTQEIILHHHEIVKLNTSVRVGKDKLFNRSDIWLATSTP